MKERIVHICCVEKTSLPLVNMFPFRLRKIIEHCITIWKTSLVKAYTGYLCKAKEALMDYHEQKQMERAGKSSYNCRFVYMTCYL